MARIVWSPHATQQFEDVLDYISADSEIQATRVAKKINESVKRLETFPEIGALVSKYERQGIREVLAFHYRIMYQTQKNNTVVRIVAVIHEARKLTRKRIDL